MLFQFLFLLLGLALLILGAEGLVRGASSAASKWGISSLVIGLTIVSFGTSAPELLVNMLSAWNGATDLAIGNIIGSNIANILLILGITALIYPLSVKRNTTFKEVPFALLAVVLVFLMGNDGFFDGQGFNMLSRTDGFAFIALFIIFLYYTYGISKIKGDKEHITEYSWTLSLFYFLGGIILLAIGGHIIVENAIALAKGLNISERIIGLTIVAIGTSLPELATSVVAALRKHTDIAVGNAVGSNIFNVFWILGITSIMSPIPFSPSINIDVFISIIATLLLFLLVLSSRKKQIERWHGLFFLLLYISYMIFIAFTPFCLPAYCAA